MSKLARPNGTEIAETDAGDDTPERSEPKTYVVVAGFLFQGAILALFVLALCWFKDAAMLGVILTGLVLLSLTTQLDKLKTLTSGWVSFETREAVQRADDATARAHRAADLARKTANKASAAALKADERALEAHKAAKAAGEEAEIVKGHLRSVVAKVAEATFLAMSSANRQGDEGDARETESIEESRSALRAIGCDEQAVRRAIEPIVMTRRAAWAQGIAMKAHNLLNNRRASISPEDLEATGKAMERVAAFKGRFFETMPASEVRAILDDLALLNDRILTSYLEGYEKLEREFPRPETAA